MAEEEENQENQEQNNKEAEKGTEGQNQEAGGEDEPEEGEESSGKSSKKKLIISLIAITLLVIILGILGYYMFGGSGGKKDSETKDKKEQKESSEEMPKKSRSSGGKSPNQDSQYFDLEEFVVNLNPDSGKQEYLKLVITIQINKNTNIKQIENKLPVLRDNINTFLTTLKSEDIKGSAGVAMLKEELLRRMNLLLDPIEIENVLLKEILIT
jgi:flagellar FliL protein